MRVLVTGASGHVGGGIVSWLLERGCKVVGLSRSEAGARSMEQYIRSDISSLSFVEQALARIRGKVDAVVHAAASLEQDPYCTSVPLTNCLGTQNVLNLACSLEVETFIYTSSVPVIGIPRELPITEDHPTYPVTAYHASKLFGEHLIRVVSGSHMRGVVLRLTSPVGTGMPANRIMPIFIERAFKNEPIVLTGKGTRKQNYVDVRDIAAAVELCLNQYVSGVFNIAGSKAISNHDLARECIRVLGSSSAINFSGAPDPQDDVSWQVSISKASDIFGYRPRFNLSDSIRAIRSGYAAGNSK